MTRLPVRETGREGVLRACLALLTAERIFHLRLNSGKVQTIRKTWVQLCPEGTPDIFSSVPMDANEGSVKIFEYSCIVWVETKSSTGPQRKAQEEFQAAAEARGEIYILARTVDVLRDWLLKNGIIRMNRGMAVPAQGSAYALLSANHFRFQGEKE